MCNADFAAISYLQQNEKGILQIGLILRVKIAYYDYIGNQ